VKNGCLVLDDPATDLPEGTVVELVVVDDEWSDEQRAALHDALAQGIEQMKNGQLMDADLALAEIRAFS
jgi:hypothetical protein